MSVEDNFFKDLVNNSEFKKIAYPEPYDERILKAVRYLKDKKLVHPILLGDKNKIFEKASSLKIKIDDIEIIEIKKKEDFAKIIFENRKGKITLEDAALLSLQPVYHAVCMLKAGYCDGVVSGASIPSKETFRPALQIIKNKEDSLASTFFIMLLKNDTYLFTDCALNIKPSSQEICDITLNAFEAAKKFGIKNSAALLSFSTLGSASHHESKKIEEAYNLLKNKYPDLEVIGEVQVDAVLDEKVGVRKGVDLLNPGIFVFPDLNSGNIGYKLVERFGGARAIGPITWGLNKPVNDLSRGCSFEDVIMVSLITSMQN